MMVIAKRCLKKFEVIYLSGTFSITLPVASDDSSVFVYEYFSLVIAADAHGAVYECLYDFSEVARIRSVSIDIAPHASVRHFIDAQGGPRTLYMSNLSLTVHEAAHYVGVLRDRGGQSRSYRFSLYADGIHSSASFTCAFSGASHETVKIVSRQHHREASSSTNLVVKAIAYEHARIEYQGCIVVDKEAHQSESTQQFSALLLAPTAYATARPALEVTAHAVRCRHGSAISKVSPEALWFLEAHCISFSRARAMLIAAFMEDVRLEAYDF